MTTFDLSKFVDLVVELAEEVDLADPIDFGMLTINEKSTRKMLASQIVEDAFKIEDRSTRELMLLATITHLVTENFVLNQKILNMVKN